MPGFDSFLTSLSDAMNALLSARNSDLADRAKATWNAQTPATQGAVAGGLLAILFSGNARKLVAASVEIGAGAFIGSLAMKAYREWQEETDVASDVERSLRLLQAMVAAASVEGAILAFERAALEVQIARLRLGPDPETVIQFALDGPLDAASIAGLARTPQEAAALYTASLLVVNRKGAAQKAYLATLAALLGLDAALVRHLEANVPAQA
jgi:uncharacterized membrane protein YebE (DUF533 family)